MEEEKKKEEKNVDEPRERGFVSLKREISRLVFLSAWLRKWRKDRRMHSFIAKSFRFVRGIRMKSLCQEVSNKPVASSFFETRVGR